MIRRIAIALSLLALVPAVRAQTPEDLLPAGTQVYIRWDGMKAHREAFNKTALGKMLAGDTGKFIDGIFAQVQDSVSGLLTVQSLLGGAAPEKLQKLTNDATEATKLLPMLGERGIVIAVEARRLEPPDGQVTIVFPDIGDKPKPFLGLMRLGAGLAQIEPKEQKIEGRSVSSIDTGPVQIAWWVDGKHGIVTVGTGTPETVVKAMAGKGEKLANNPLFKKVAGFNQFETGARGFLDVAGVVKMAKTRGEDVGKLIDDLGLDSLKSLMFYSGFDGAAERGLTEFEIEGPRKGLLALTRGKPFTLADVPPLPDDAVSWSMTNFDLPGLYDLGVKVAEHIAKLVAPEAVAKVKETIEEVNKVLGVNIRNDLLANLEGPIVQYNSPAEGPLALGSTYMVKIKNPEKLQASIDQAIEAIGQAAGADISIKKHKYRGVELREVQVRQQGFFFVPTYAIHKDWLILGYFPQSVQGYVLRSNREVPVWRPSPEVQASLDKLPKEFASISVSDPRPSVKQLLSVAPLIAGAVHSFLPDAKFDVNSVPNAHEATRHLFPNVSVVSDDGKQLRQETRASLALPIDVTGLDTYVIAFGGIGVLQYLRFSMR